MGVVDRREASTGGAGPSPMPAAGQSLLAGVTVLVPQLLEVLITEVLELEQVEGGVAAGTRAYKYGGWAAATAKQRRLAAAATAS